MENSKVCRKCNIEKSLDDFYNSKVTNDGKDKDCKECNKNKIKLPPIFFPNENKKVCTSCNVKKDLGEFYKNKKLKGGVNHHCKLCIGKSRLKRIKNIEYTTVSSKKCRTCNTIKPSDEFGKRSAHKDGLTIDCLNCINKKRREKNRLKNEGLPRKKWNKYSTQDFKEKLLETMGEDYELIGEYIPNKKNTILHKPCGRTREVLLSNVFSKGCKKCSNLLKSSLSSRIENALREIGACYKTEVILEGCIHIKPLPFDFGIYEDEKLIMLIEADGMQHFYESGYGYGTLEDIQKRDGIKNKYCKDNNIPLLRINYLQELEAKNIIVENVPKGYCKKKSKKYFTKSIVTEDLAKNIREYYVEHKCTTSELIDKFGLNRGITLKVLNYYYHPNIKIELKEQIDNNLYRAKHPKRLWEELSEEERQNVTERRQNCESIESIRNSLNLRHGFHYRLKFWNSLCKDIKPHRLEGKKCKHIETGKEFNSLREGCDYFSLSYNIQQKRINGQNKSPSEFEYINQD